MTIFWRIWIQVKLKILKNYLEGISVISQAQLLHRLLKQKCLKYAIKLLGIKSIKEVNTNEIISKNMTSALATLARKRSRDLMCDRKTLLTGAVEKTLQLIVCWPWLQER